ncbi:MAG: hypothetical protein IJX28_01895 [Clostridia bacterium]|nr:hypothetical protein [Clostridia bacterium]
MRNLTVCRRKSFVACLGTMKLYVEDAENSELTINGVPCRKLGNLKNGEEKTFSIEENAVKLFVIADKVSKGYCNEFMQLPEGSEDISLCGQNHFNPGKGNPFYFDGVTDAATLQNRKKGAVAGWGIMVLAVLLGVVIGLVASGAFLFAESPETFSASGMEITLTDAFSKTEMEPYAACYDSRHVAVFVLKESFAEYPGVETLTLEEYGDLWLEVNGIASEFTTENGLYTCVYEFTNSDNGKTYTYRNFLFKSDDAFWTFQFATESTRAEEHLPKIYEWAGSVRFS